MSYLGYKDNSPDRNNPYNIIPGSHITMKGVSKTLTLIPIVGGKPDYKKRVIARPGDPDIHFGEGVEAVLEIPYAQIGLQTPSGYQRGPFSLDYRHRVNEAGLYGHNPYDVAEGIDPLTGQSFNADSANIIGNNAGNINNNVIGKAFVPSLDPSGAPKPKNIFPPAYTGNVVVGNPMAEARASTMGVWSSPVEKTEMNMPTEEVENYKKSLEGYGGDKSSEKEGKDEPFISGFNPYVGWDMASSAAALGAFAKYKPEGSLGTGAKITGLLGAAGKLGFEGFRNFMQGYAGMNRFQQAQAEKAKRMKEAQRKDSLHVMKKGGYLTKMATGNFIEGSDNHPNPNVEVEKGEYIQTPGGSTMEVLGERHSEGGELLNLPGGSKIISDYLKIGTELARFFKKNFKLNVTSGSKFATVLDQYKRKIGLSELLEEEEKLIKKMKSLEGIENDGVRSLNVELLNEKYQEDILPKKKELEEKFKLFTNLVFDRQEVLKNEEKEHNKEMYYKQEGGGVPMEQSPEQQGGGIEQLIQMYAQIVGVDPNQIIAQIQKMPEHQRQNALQQMIETVEQAQGQMQGQVQGEESEEVPVPEQQPEMRYGGGLTSLRYLRSGGVYRPTHSTYRPEVQYAQNGGRKKMMAT